MTTLLPVRTAEAPRARRLPSTGTLPETLTDAFARPMRDLRISVTDRCNFRCVYCMPKSVFGRDYAFLEHDELLSFDEITRLAGVAVAHGVHKLRLTGGEPLLRRGIEQLVERLAALRTPEGQPVEIALTTNGSALAVKAAALEGGRPHPGHGVARLARRRGVPVDERRAVPGRPRARRHAGRARCRARTDQGQHGRQARAQRPRGPAHGTALQGLPVHAAVHRVHGRRHVERLAARRGRALCRDHRGHRRRAAARADRRQRRPARPPPDGATSTAAARSA